MVLISWGGLRWNLHGTGATNLDQYGLDYLLILHVKAICVACHPHFEIRLQAPTFDRLLI